MTPGATGGAWESCCFRYVYDNQVNGDIDTNLLCQCLYGYAPFAGVDIPSTKFNVKVILILTPWKGLPLTLNIKNHHNILSFPYETESDKMLSHDVITLILQLLQDRENRLCSSKYMANDLGSGGQLKAQGPSPVYSDDATDIKAHPFFEGIDWESQHTSTPIFNPKPKHIQQEGFFHSRSDREKEREIARVVKRKEEQKLKVPSKDPILRDAKTGPVALEIRTKGAFLGYTYKRPTPPVGLG